MIKWAWYWKSLKLLFFGLLISCFTFLGNSFVSADNIDWSHYQLVGLSSSTSFVDSQYEITFLKWWWLLSNFLWYSRSLFALSDKVLFRRTPNWLPYVYADQLNWYFNKASSCDSLLSWWNYVTPSNCSEFDINLWTWPTIFKNFFENVNQWDVVYYKYRFYPWNNATTSFSLCFNSDELNKSICFDSCVINWTSLCSSNLSWSIDFWTINVWFTTIPQSYIWPAPWQNWYWWNYWWSDLWSTELDNNSVITWDFVYSECTVWEVKALAEKSWMNPYVCYAWLSVSDTWFQVWTAWTWSSVYELFQSTTDWKNFRDWFDYWDKIFDNRYVYSDTIRQNQPSALYSYFNFYNQYWPEFWAIDIENYCRIIVNNLSESSKWTWLPSLCPIVSWPYINDWLWFDSSWEFNWNVAVWVNRNWVWNMTWNDNTDAISFIQNFFNKAKSVIPTDYNWVAVWVLPTYIILFLCAIILFRFISH